MEGGGGDRKGRGGDSTPSRPQSIFMDTPMTCKIIKPNLKNLNILVTDLLRPRDGSIRTVNSRKMYVFLMQEPCIRDLADNATMSHFTFWISLSLRPKTETKRLNFGLRPVLSLTNYRSPSSLTSSATHR